MGIFSTLLGTTASGRYVKPEVNLESVSLRKWMIWQRRQSNGQTGPNRRYRARRIAGSVGRCRGLSGSGPMHGKG